MNDETISKLKKMLFEDGKEMFEELDREQVSKAYFIAGLAKACAENPIWEEVNERYKWLEPLMLILTSDAFDNAIEIQKELQNEDR